MEVYPQGNHSQRCDPISVSSFRRTTTDVQTTNRTRNDLPEKKIPRLARQHKKNLQKTRMLHLLKTTEIPAESHGKCDKDDSTYPPANRAIIARGDGWCSSA